MSSTEILREVKQAISEPSAWPGGYPKYIVMGDGEALSIEAARSEWRLIAHSTMTLPSRRGTACDVKWSAYHAR